MKKFFAISMLIVLATFVLCGCTTMDEKEKIEKRNYDCDTNYLPRVNFGAKFEPKGNYILHGAGQGLKTSFEDYSKALGKGALPCVYNGYVSPHHKYVDWLTDTQNLMAIYNEDTDYIMYQIGVHFNKDENPDECYYDKVASGEMDADVKALIKVLKALKAPVYCRAGFEFNGEWNGYKDPEIYKKAFIRFSQLVKECEADNIALVWCMNPDAREKDFMKYYPGDEYVDWFAIDIFRIGSAFSQTTEDFLAKANEHSKPVMVAESTPYMYDVTKGQGWTEWFEQYFKFVRENPVIKSTFYINWEWTKWPQWSNWGDARIELATNGILEKYRKEMTDPVYFNRTSKEKTLDAIYGAKSIK